MKKEKDCKGHQGWKHALMMAVCCLVPAFLSATLSQAGYNSIFVYTVLILCPLMHLFMMRRMKRDS